MAKMGKAASVIKLVSGCSRSAEAERDASGAEVIPLEEVDLRKYASEVSARPPGQLCGPMAKVFDRFADLSKRLTALEETAGLRRYLSVGGRRH
jgi:hypothetical protein